MEGKEMINISTYLVLKSEVKETHTYKKILVKIIQQQINARTKTNTPPCHNDADGELLPSKQ